MYFFFIYLYCCILFVVRCGGWFVFWGCLVIVLLNKYVCNYFNFYFYIDLYFYIYLGDKFVKDVVFNFEFERLCMFFEVYFGYVEGLNLRLFFFLGVDGDGNDDKDKDGDDWLIMDVKFDN